MRSKSRSHLHVKNTQPDGTTWHFRRLFPVIKFILCELLAFRHKVKTYQTFQIAFQAQVFKITVKWWKKKGVAGRPFFSRIYKTHTYPGGRSNSFRFAPMSDKPSAWSSVVILSFYPMPILRILEPLFTINLVSTHIDDTRRGADCFQLKQCPSRAQNIVYFHTFIVVVSNTKCQGLKSKWRF